MSLMYHFLLLKYVTLLMILLPAVAFCGLSLWAFFGLPWRENWIERITRAVMLTLGLGSLVLVWFSRGALSIPFYYGDVISFAQSSIGLHLKIDTLSLTYLVTSGFIAAV